VQAHRTASQVFVPDMAATLSTPARYTAQELGAVSGLVQPVGRPDSPCGVLGVAWERRIGSLPPRIASVMELLADEAAIALGRAALMRDLETAALTDPLTGLPNLRAWDDALARELATASRDGRPVCVAVADLDGFKGFNDTHGHLAGDRLLRAAVAAWQQSLRAGDVLARLGGDEFAILLPTCRTDGAVALAERLRRSTPGDRTCSVGIAEWDGSERAHELVARADTALYEAKARGRDRVVAL
jgi:diguanylate cyclase (GGDEF)-like protein